MSDGDSRKSFRVNRLHHAARIKRTTKNFKTALAKNFAKIDKSYSKTAVRFIAAVSADRLPISEPVERRFDADVARGFEDGSEHSFRNRENVVRRYERSFNIDLRKFRLPVRTQIFVAKTFRDLEIFFHARHHEELFVLLRRLRQRVEFSGRDSARHQKIARAFRRAFGKNRRLNLDVALAVEIIARRLRRDVSQPQIARQPGAAQIEISIGHPQIFAVWLGVDRERQRVGPI